MSEDQKKDGIDGMLNDTAKINYEYRKCNGIKIWDRSKESTEILAPEHQYLISRTQNQNVHCESHAAIYERFKKAGLVRD